MKKYYFKGEIVTKIGEDPPLTVIKLQSGKFGAVDPESLIEVREPREWEGLTYANGTVHIYGIVPESGVKVMVREVLATSEGIPTDAEPTTNLTPISSSLTEEWRELGPEEVIQEGDEVTNGGVYWEKAVGSIGYTLNRWNEEIGKLKARRRVTLPAATGGEDMLQKEEKFNTFPEVGARLRVKFTGFQNKGIKEGDEFKVIEHNSKIFITQFGWEFDEDWQDGLELVTEPLIPDLTELHAKGREAWKDVPDATAWVEEQRGHLDIPEGFPPVPETTVFKVGDRVRIVKKVDPCGPGWHPNMDQWIGKEATIEDVHGGFGIKLCTILYMFPFESLELIPSVAPLQLEVGKYYLNRKGERVGPLVANAGAWGDSHPFRCPSFYAFAWKADGRFERDDEPQDWDYDLISLAPDEDLVVNEPEDSATQTDLSVGNEPQASYPPPESEWPEKPDPGVGMVWERQSKSGEFISGERYVILTCDYKEWRDNSPDLVGWYERIVFRAAPKSKLLDALEGIAWIAGSRGDDWTMLSALESVKSRAVTALKEHQGDTTPTPVTEDPEEARAKAALEEGWTVPISEAHTFGQTILHGIDDNLVIVMHRGIHGWRTPENMPHVLLPHQVYTQSLKTLMGSSDEIVIVGLNSGKWQTVWAKDERNITKRSGTELARLNGLEPEAIQRWSLKESWSTPALQMDAAGDFIRYSDHVAAIEALTGKGGADA